MSEKTSEEVAWELVDALARLARCYDKGIGMYAAFHGPTCRNEAHSGDMNPLCRFCAIDLALPHRDELNALMERIRVIDGAFRPRRPLPSDEP